MKFLIKLFIYNILTVLLYAKSFAQNSNINSEVYKALKKINDYSNKNLDTSALRMIGVYEIKKVRKYKSFKLETYYCKMNNNDSSNTYNIQLSICYKNDKFFYVLNSVSINYNFNLSNWYWQPEINADSIITLVNNFFYKPDFFYNREEKQNFAFRFSTFKNKYHQKLFLLDSINYQENLYEYEKCFWVDLIDDKKLNPLNSGLVYSTLALNFLAKKKHKALFEIMLMENERLNWLLAESLYYYNSVNKCLSKKENMIIEKFNGINGFKKFRSILELSKYYK